MDGELNVKQVSQFITKPFPCNSVAYKVTKSKYLRNVKALYDVGFSIGF
jgi:hypothetical protein